MLSASAEDAARRALKEATSDLERELESALARALMRVAVLEEHASRHMGMIAQLQDDRRSLLEDNDALRSRLEAMSADVSELTQRLIDLHSTRDLNSPPKPHALPSPAPELLVLHLETASPAVLGVVEPPPLRAVAAEVMPLPVQTNAPPSPAASEASPSPPLQQQQSGASARLKPSRIGKPSPVAAAAAASAAATASAAPNDVSPVPAAAVPTRVSPPFAAAPVDAPSSGGAIVLSSLFPPSTAAPPSQPPPAPTRAASPLAAAAPTNEAPAARAAGKPDAGLSWISTLRVVDLKQQLKTRGVEVSGKELKAELQEKLRRALGASS